MKHMADFQENGWIGHVGHDGKLEFGDGSQRLGMFILLKYILTDDPISRLALAREFSKMIGHIRLPGGEWVRHPDPDRWWGQAGTMSRDQLIPMIAAMAVMNRHAELMDLENHLDKRGFFAWNTKGIWETKGWKIPDWIGPVVWAMFERGKINFGFPKTFGRLAFLYFADFILILHSLARIITPVFAPDHTSADKAHFIKLITAKKICPTFFSELAALIYFKFRPKGADWAFAQYFAPDSAPPLDRIMIEARKAVFPDG